MTKTIRHYIVNFFKIFISALLFGIGIASIPPYPNEYDYIILTISATLFATVASLNKASHTRNKLCLFGMMTFISFVSISLWYWKTDLWYPPQIPIIEQFFFTDGEAGMDADVSNVFLICWFLLIFVMYGVPFIKFMLKKFSEN